MFSSVSNDYSSVVSTFKWRVLILFCFYYLPFKILSSIQRFSGYSIYAVTEKAGGLSDLISKNSPAFLFFYLIPQMSPPDGVSALHSHSCYHFILSWSSAAISASTASAVSRLSALMEMYALSFGSVPEGRITTEQWSLKRYFSTSDFGSPSNPGL